MTMKKIIVLCLLVSGCATDASRAYEQARYEANPSWQSVSNQEGRPLYYTPKDQNMGQFFRCLFKANQRLSSEDSRYVCSY